MAIFHLSAKVVSRGGGRSAVAASAYRSGEKLRDERTGDEHDYSRKGGVVYSEIIAPENAPDWMKDRAQLWNAVEKVEKRKDAQLAREIELALPRELPLPGQVALLQGFVRQQFVERGMIADIAIHHVKARDGQSQPHAHVMLTMRDLVSGGFGQKNRDWNDNELLQGWREAWAREVNLNLQRAGHNVQIDHRSLEVQREEAQQRAQVARGEGNEARAKAEEARAAQLDREPETKLGPYATQLEKAGIASERGNERRAAQERNSLRQQARELQQEITRRITGTARQAVEQAREKLEALWERAQRAHDIIRERLGSREKDMAERDRAGMNKASADAGGAERAREQGREAELRDRLLGRVPDEKQQQRDPGRTVDREALLGRKTDPPQIEKSPRERNITPEKDRDRGR